MFPNVEQEYCARDKKEWLVQEEERMCMLSTEDTTSERMRHMGTEMAVWRARRLQDVMLARDQGQAQQQCAGIFFFFASL